MSKRRSNRAISVFLATSLMASNAFADCKWSEGVTKSPDQTHYDYTSECHDRVGKSLKELDLRTEQVHYQNGAISNLQSAILSYKRENDTYREGMKRVEARVETAEKVASKNKVIYFFIGVGTAVLITWATSQAQQK